MANWIKWKKVNKYSSDPSSYYGNLSFYDHTIVAYDHKKISLNYDNIKYGWNIGLYVKINNLNIPSPGIIVTADQYCYCLHDKYYNPTSLCRKKWHTEFYGGNVWLTCRHRDMIMNEI